MNWFKRKPKSRTSLHLESFPLSSAQFRSITENRNAANRVFQMQEFQAMYGCLIQDRPSKGLILGLPPHVNSAHANYCKGYEDCLEKLLLLGIDPQEIKESPMTFEEEL